MESAADLWHGGVIINDFDTPSFQGLPIAGLCELEILLGRGFLGQRLGGTQEV